MQTGHIFKVKLYLNNTLCTFACHMSFRLYPQQVEIRRVEEEVQTCSYAFLVLDSDQN